MTKDWNMINLAKESPLLPDRHPTLDFFVCDILDAAPKADMGSMEHPIFSLSTKPDHRIKRYEHNGNYIEIKPSSNGLATVYDRDIIIYCISQLVAAANSGREVSQVVHFKAHDLLTATNRPTGGSGYAGLKAAMVRLQGTQIETNIVTGGEEVFEVFSLINSAKVVRETREGRMQEIEIRLADWVFNALKKKEVLTLHRNYFRLRKPMERRMYEIARKHCGRKSSWRISIELLKKKCGSTSSTKEFRRLILNIVEQDEKHNHMPDYSIRFAEYDMLEFCNKETIPNSKEAATEIKVSLSPDTYHDARLEAPGWDVYELEREWRDWMTEPPRSPNAAFLGFCRKVYQRRGRPS